MFIFPKMTDKTQHEFAPAVADDDTNNRDIFELERKALLNG
jgi:hypothetical protein